MRNKFFISSILAAGLLGTSAIAQTTVGGGATASGRNGSIAGGVTAGTMKSNEREHERQERRAERMRGNSASTYGSGSVYTDRHRATGGVTAGGSATGSGAQATSTSIDAYGSTTRDGSDAEVYGDSTARSDERR